MISVVLPTYNRADILALAINSVLAQTHADLELLVIDDGSTDGTRDLVAGIAREDGRVKYHVVPHAGAPSARNHGILASSGAYIAFQDSDDEWDDRFLAELLAVARPNRLVFSSHRVHGTNGSTEVVPPAYVARPERALLRTNIISTQTVLVGRELLESVNFDPHLRRFQDWDLWMSLIEAGGTEIVHVPEVLVTVRRQSDSISEGDPDVRDAALRRVLKKHYKWLARDPVALVRIVLRSGVRPALRWTQRNLAR